MGSNFSCVGMILLRMTARLARSLPAALAPGATAFRLMPRLWMPASHSGLCLLYSTGIS